MRSVRNIGNVGKSDWEKAVVIIVLLQASLKHGSTQRDLRVEFFIH